MVVPTAISSYERGCQGKKLLPAPREDAGMVTYIQPHHTLRGVIGLAALARRAFQRRGQPQLLVPTRRFHEAVVLERQPKLPSSVLKRKFEEEVEPGEAFAQERSFLLVVLERVS